MRKTPDRDIAAALSAALKAAKDFPPNAYVKEERIYRKRKRFDPTPRQAALLRWIEKQGFVKQELSFAMHWGMLGGLMARGRVVPAEKDGVKGLRAAG